MHASESKLSKELKSGIQVLIGPMVSKLWIETVQMMFVCLFVFLFYFIF